MSAEDMLVTPKELRDYMSGIDLTPPQEEAAKQAIMSAQGDLERYCNRKFRVQQYTETEWTDCNGFLYLKHTPIVSIVSVVTLPSANPLPSPYLTGFDVWPGYVDLAIKDAKVTIVYTAGKVLPEMELESVKSKIMEVAARTVTSNHDDTISIKGGLERDTDPPRPIKGWTEEELWAFSRYRRRVVV